jgi:hypothetical protein
MNSRKIRNEFYFSYLLENKKIENKKKPIKEIQLILRRSNEEFDYSEPFLEYFSYVSYSFSSNFSIPKK